MIKNIYKNDLVKNFKDRESFTTDDVYSFFSRFESGIKRTTVRWRIYNLIQQSVLKRLSRGVYSIGKGKSFIHTLTNEQKKIFQKIKKSFPYISICCWDLSILGEFFHHLPKVKYFVVEVEKEALGAVYYFLKEYTDNIFKDPNKEMIENYIIDKQGTVIVKTLISESPKVKIDGIEVPSIEKVLVDILAEKKLFYFLQGHELLIIYENAFNKYTIQISKLIRYAKRRGKEKEVKGVLKQINGNNLYILP